MSEWHVTPDYIVNNWTDELLNLMVEKLVERKKQEQPESTPRSRGTVSAEELSLLSNNMIKVVQN